MKEVFAQVILAGTSMQLDRSFQYGIPASLKEKVAIGRKVVVPFGSQNQKKTAYIIEIDEKLEVEPEKLKWIEEIDEKAVSIESQFIQLAFWLRARYGGTLSQALKTVLTTKKVIPQKEKKMLKCNLSNEQITFYLEKYKTNGRYRARVRLLQAFLEQKILSFAFVQKELNLSSAVWNYFVEKKEVEIQKEEFYRNPAIKMSKVAEKPVVLNQAQRYIVDSITKNYRQGNLRNALIYGITGSGKTEVYCGIIAQLRKQNKQVIVLIPEIALTWQTVRRFFEKFGDEVSFIHSRLSEGERYDQYQRAKRGEISIMVGPRSALFSPFEQLGCIIIDEEHESSYQSETVPRYDAKEVAKKRAKQSKAFVIFASATPSVESMYKAKQGEYDYYQLEERAVKGSTLPETQIVDLRQELQEGNRSVFSRSLQEEISLCLEKKQQVILFLNRRGYAGFLSCRSCGKIIECPHCSVSLTLHQNKQLLCHYCGYQQEEKKLCPHCGSPYLGTFGLGTQKVEEMTKKQFPQAKVLRMDMDTTKKKGAAEHILEQFSQQKADILIGTQMIVKGHDFPHVTLVGILAADLSLGISHYQASEKTFQLLVQAIGRAGRGKEAGKAIIQSYQPEHYSVVAAARQDIEEFYEQECLYRKMLCYPPFMQMNFFLLFSSSEEALDQAGAELAQFIRATMQENVLCFGPLDAPISKMKDIFRKIIHLKSADPKKLMDCKKQVEEFLEQVKWKNKVFCQFGTN
ncbi:primosomal protein N' [Clostridia bacterium]|nr:primosomal protein N' [Clostridia bacterium]